MQTIATGSDATWHLLPVIRSLPSTVFEPLSQLNPHDAHYWFDLAAAYQVTGDIADQRTALDRALQAEPTAPDVAWEAANFFLIDGDIDRALHEFHVVIENDNSLVDAALRACWRVRPDADALLRDVVPARTDSLIAFLHLLMSKQETDGAIKTWDRLAQLHEKFPNSLSVRLRALSHWSASSRRRHVCVGTSRRRSRPLRLLADGGQPGRERRFQSRHTERRLRLDLRQSNRSAAIARSERLPRGSSLSFAHIRRAWDQRRWNTTTDSGARRNYLRLFGILQIGRVSGSGRAPDRSARCLHRAPLFASDPLNDADFWKEVHSKMTIPNSTTLLVLAIERFPAGSPIRGKLWLDDFELSPA